MGIALIIVGGIVVVTAVASVFDYLGKKRKGGDPQVEGRLAALEQRLAAAETKIEERDEKIAQIENDVAFVNRLIEDKSK
jgi:hypothetical protein